MTLMDFFHCEGIELFSVLDFKDARVINENKINKHVNFTPKSILIFALPYYVGDIKGGNISKYAFSKDYHLYFKDLSGRLISLLSKRYPTNSFLAFADSSPIDERHAASVSGLGIIGKNGLLITEKYGSYVFLGEVISDLEASEYFGTHAVLHTPSSCIGCNRCLSACPANRSFIDCLSQVTQKKGELTSEEAMAITTYGSVWGCDICQSVCPHNQNIAKTPIHFFHEEIIHFLDTKLLQTMTKEEFSKRAWAWRGKNTLLRNLKIYEENKK